MKKILSIALVVLAATFVFLYRQQARKTADQETQAAVARQRLAEVEVETARQEQRNHSEQKRLSAANAQLAEKVARATAAEQALATNARATRPDVAKPPHPMAEMLRDPDMMEVFRKQAREAVARNVKGLMSTNLLQALGLAREQTVELKQLLTQRGALGFDFMMPMMTGELDETGLAELGRKTKADMAVVTDQLKTLLGEEGYKTLESFEKSQPDRDRVEKLGARLNETGQPLKPEQQSQLLAAMAEERNNFRFAIDYNDTAQIDFEHFNDLYAEENMDRYFKELESLDDLVTQRAQLILSTEQAAEFQELLKVQRQKGKYVVKNTTAMLGKRSAR